MKAPEGLIDKRGLDTLTIANVDYTPVAVNKAKTEELIDKRKVSSDIELNNRYEPIYVSVAGKPTVVVETQQGISGKDGVGGVAASSMQFSDTISFNSINPMPLKPLEIEGTLFSLSLQIIVPFDTEVEISLTNAGGNKALLPLGDYGFNEAAGTQIDLDLSHLGITVVKGEQLYANVVAVAQASQGKVKFVAQLTV